MYLCCPISSCSGGVGAGVSPLQDGAILAFSGCVRNRLVNNALIFASQCWGQVALKEVPQGMSPYHKNYSL